MKVEKFLEKFEANKTSVTKETAARLMRITEKGFMNERRKMDFMVIIVIISRMKVGKYGEILANFGEEKKCIPQFKIKFIFAE